MTAPSDPVEPLAVEAAVHSLLTALGFSVGDCAGLQDTPGRVSRSWTERLSGYSQDDSCLGRVFEEPTADAGLVVLRDIEFHSTCEHHLLPFSGVAHVAYIPSNGRVVGLSKLARIVQVYALRLQLQERLTREVCESLDDRLSPVGSAVVIEAKHGCMVCRGVRQQRASMVTSVMRGVFLEDPSARAEMLRMLNGGLR